MDYERLGKPSLVWGDGQERRFQIIKEHLSLEGRKVLDFGCGTGVYTNRFEEEGARAWGVDIDEESIEKARKNYDSKFIVSKEIPFEDDYFDIVFSNEVLEHVENDSVAVEEMLRVLKEGGRLVAFVPNKWFPFETHGMRWRGEYVFGNIPFLSWAPNFVRDIFAPHVRIYTMRGLLSLFNGVDVVEKGWVYPAFDRVERRCSWLGGFLKKTVPLFERVPLIRRFGISILLVVDKKN